ncbi:18262_t:CDS:2, partial [Gigaspora margarita]
MLANFLLQSTKKISSSRKAAEIIPKLQDSYIQNSQNFFVRKKDPGNVEKEGETKDLWDTYLPALTEDFIYAAQQLGQNATPEDSLI